MLHLGSRTKCGLSDPIAAASELREISCNFLIPTFVSFISVCLPCLITQFKLLKLILSNQILVWIFPVIPLRKRVLHMAQYWSGAELSESFPLFFYSMRNILDILTSLVSYRQTQCWHDKSFLDGKIKRKLVSILNRCSWF